MRTIGLFAGQGDLPLQILMQCHHHKQPLFLVAFEGQTDPELVNLQKKHTHNNTKGYMWTHFGAVGKTVDYLKSNQVTHIVMAGSMKRPSWSEIRPDCKGLQWMAKMGIARMGSTSLGDDGLLSSLVNLLKEEGFTVISPADILASLLASEGVLGIHQPGLADWTDILRGKDVACSLGANDVGQAVVVQEGLILGVEAIEGTEALLSRCSALRREGRGGVLVKMAKPNQSQLVDLPTIGVATIHQAKAAGLRGIAIEAGLTQILNQQAVVQAADEAGLYLVGIAAS